MITQRIRRRTLLVATPATVLLAGCDPDRAASGYPVPEGPPTAVTYLTNFLQLGRDAYAYLAQERGYFAAANLDVTIEPGTGTTGNLEALLTGEAQFAAVDMAGAIIARDQQDGFVALAAVQQLPLAAVMTYDQGIQHPQDLERRRVGLPQGAVTELLFPLYADLAQVDRSRVAQVSMPGGELLPALAGGQVDAIGQFVVGQPLVEQAAGSGEVVVLPYSDYLHDLYGVCLFTTVELAEQDPGLCVRFRDALLQGLLGALDEPQAAGQALAQHAPDTDPEVAAAELELMQPYTQVPAGNREFGSLDLAKTARAIAVLQANGLVRPSLPPDELVAFDLAPGADPPG